MTRIGIILGSTRPGRNGEQVAKWVYDIASRRTDAEFELVDLRDYPLPHLDEPMPREPPVMMATRWTFPLMTWPALLLWSSPQASLLPRSCSGGPLAPVNTLGGTLVSRGLTGLPPAYRPGHRLAACTSR